MNKLFIHNTIFRICSGPVYGILVYLIILLVNNSVIELDSLFSSSELYVAVVLSYVAFEAMRAVIHLIEKRNSRWPSIQARVVTQLIATVVISTTLVGISIACYYRFVVGFTIGSSELKLFVVIFGGTSFLYNLLYFSQYYVLRENKHLLETESQLQQKLEADFYAFKNEINPDLLYESLENLILSVHHQAEHAEEQIDYLASIYRYTLINRNKELIVWQEEFDIAQVLINLINFRHRHIKLIAEVSESSQLYLIPGSLLVTLDSIVRNTLISEKNPLVIRFYLEDDYLVLQHALNDRLVYHKESQESFKRLQRSYSFLSETPFIQVKAGRENFVKFPLMELESTNDLTA